MPKLELLLIRHSLTEGNLLRRYVGVTDEPLCSEGIALARRAASELAFAPQKIYRSPLLRCAQTAEILFGGADEMVIPQLIECDFGIFEGKTHAELEQLPEYIKWVASEGGFTPPGGESGDDAQKRCAEALDAIIYDMQKNGVERAAVVTHGGVIMRIMDRLFGGGIYKWQPENCGGWLLQTGDTLSYQKVNTALNKAVDDISAIF